MSSSIEKSTLVRANQALDGGAVSPGFVLPHRGIARPRPAASAGLNGGSIREHLDLSGRNRARDFGDFTESA
jgi:hypothetical protein